MKNGGLTASVFVLARRCNDDIQKAAASLLLSCPGRCAATLRALQRVRDTRIANAMTEERGATAACARSPAWAPLAAAAQLVARCCWRRTARGWGCGQNCSRRG